MSIERHDRTDRFLTPFLDVSQREKFYNSKIIITGDDTLNSTNGILMAKTLVNLVARFTNDLHVSLPDKFSKFEEELILLAKSTSANSNSEIPENPEVIIIIGNSNLKGGFVIRINSDGWVSYLTCNKPLSLSTSSPNPIGAMGSACFGATECFKRLLKSQGSNDPFVSEHPGDFVFSFLDYSLTDNNEKFPSKINIDENVLLVGVGAVGSAVVYGLSEIPNIKGMISVVDNDIFNGTNLNRCLIAFVDTLGKNKAEITSLYSSEDLTFQPHSMTYENFRDKIGLNHPLILSTVDNNEVRHEIQSDLPKLIFHGSTGEQKAAISVIKFLENACFGCIYQSKPKSREEIIARDMGIPLKIVTKTLKNNASFSEEHLEYLKEKLGDKGEDFRKHIGRPFEEVFQKEICGKIKIQTEDGQKDASVSFVSFFAGLGIISEFVKYLCKIQDIPMINDKDFYRINMFKPSHLRGPFQYVKNPECIFSCSDIDFQQIFAKKWGIPND